MSWGYYRTPTVAQQKSQAEQRLAKLRKKDAGIQPITIEGSKVAKTWWGISWCRNLERYADYENRIGRGRSYVKNGFVLDLRIAESFITALVSGSSVYRVAIIIDRLPEKKWSRIASACAKRIDSIAALAEGRFPEALQGLFFGQDDGLFPSPKEIKLHCDCPDQAYMCKHIAAALYGVGAKLDTDPLLFFTLRAIDPTELIKKSVEEKMGALLAKAGQKRDRVIDDADIGRIFGV
jgi:uncharacterized Zn finger protein